MSRSFPRPPIRGGSSIFGPHHIDELGARYGLSADNLHAIRTISQALPFKVNEYVLSTT